MKITLVANPKGGAGKSTVATNIAGYFASRGHAVMLGDADAQQSSRLWLQQRPPTLPPIATWEIQGDKWRHVRPPQGTTHVVIDTPAGLSGTLLKDLVSQADKIVVPIQASLFDMQATHDFIAQIRSQLHGDLSRVGLVANRLNPRTLSAAKLREFLVGLNLPVLGYLRDTQYYVHLAAHGLSLFDITPSKVETDLTLWQPIGTWLDR